MHLPLYPLTNGVPPGGMCTEVGLMEGRRRRPLIDREKDDYDGGDYK